MFRKEILAIIVSVILLSASTVKATTITFESGHHVWTNADPYYDEVFLKNDASLDFLGGTMGQLSTLDESLANLDGGSMSHLWTTLNSVVNYYSGGLDDLASGHNSTVYLYAYDVTYDPIGGINNQGYVEGFFYKNNNPFSFSCWNTPTWSHIEIVPEPTTLLILGLGTLMIRKRK